MKPLLIAFSIAWMTTTAAAEPSQTQAARDVLTRLMGARAAEFDLKQIPRDGDKDVFIVGACAGKVFVRGSSGVALSRGAYHYLRENGLGMVGWISRRVELPEHLPEFPETRVVSPHSMRLHLNQCAFAYSTAFWQWPEWERELDWMALHGINLPLASVATEAIWERVWKEMGLTQDELDDYFIGPGYLPFQRMNCINRHGGPLTATWHRRSIELQKKILARMRELGMEPMAPAFTGSVPPTLKRIRPEAQLRQLPAWAGMPQDQRVWILDPRSPLYEEIGRKFIREWKKEFGPAKHFMADSFIESEPPVSEDRETRLRELADFGRSVFNSIVAGEPDATWYMQGWLFHYKRAFWDEESIRAFLSKVPNDRMVLIDLFNEGYQGWERLDGFFGKDWMYGLVFNFGARTPLTGNLQFYATDPIRPLRNPTKSRQVGFALSPEGVENNEVAYELITDMMWRDEPIDLDTWLREYAIARYGACPKKMYDAWKLLSKTCYGEYIHYARHGFQRVPVLKPDARLTADEPFRQAVKLFLDCAPELGGNSFYRADAIELVTHWAGVKTTELLAAAGAAHTNGNAALRDARAKQAFDLMEQMDTLLAAHPIYRLERWLELARACATTPEELRQYEWNARMQVTLWGGTRLSDYAAKVWSGLVRDYYLPRWKLFFEQLDSGQTTGVREWEKSWVERTEFSPTRPPKDPLAFARQLTKRLERLQPAQEPER